MRGTLELVPTKKLAAVCGSFRAADARSPSKSMLTASTPYRGHSSDRSRSKQEWTKKRLYEMHEWPDSDRMRRRALKQVSINWRYSRIQGGIRIASYSRCSRNAAALHGWDTRAHSLRRSLSPPTEAIPNQKCDLGEDKPFRCDKVVWD